MLMLGLFDPPQSQLNLVTTKTGTKVEIIISTAQKMKFSIKDFFSKCDQIRRKTADLVTFTEQILNDKLHFLCSALLQSLLQSSPF